MRVGRYQDLIKKALIAEAVRAFFRSQKVSFEYITRGVEPPDPIPKPEVTLYMPRAFAIADGSVGLVELESHVRVPQGDKHRSLSRFN